jgi:ACS family glucarate transporter-like MFS transporter
MNIRWRIVSLLMIAAIINYIDRVNLSYAAPNFMREFGVTPGEMGIVLSAFLWSYFIAQIPFGLAVDRFGVRVIFGVAGLLWGAATMLTATASGPAGMIAWRVLLGIGEAPMVPASTKVLGIWVADRERGIAAALGGIAGVPIGVFISSPLIGWLLADYGWQAVFVATGALAIIWGIIWIAYYRDPARHRGLGDPERRFLADNIRKLDPSGAIQQVSWRALLANRNVLGLSLGQSAVLFNLYFLLTWLPTYLVEQHHLTILRTGLYGSIPWVFGLLGVVTGGYGSDMLIRRGWPILWARKMVMASGLILGTASLLSVFTVSLTATLLCLSLGIPRLCENPDSGLLNGARWVLVGA